MRPRYHERLRRNAAKLVEHGAETAVDVRLVVERLVSTGDEAFGGGSVTRIIESDETYPAMVGSGPDPRLEMREGGQTGERSGRLVLSARLAGVPWAELVERFGPHDITEGDSRRRVLYVGGRHAVIEQVLADGAAEVVVVAYRVGEGG